MKSISTNHRVRYFLIYFCICYQKLIALLIAKAISSVSSLYNNNERKDNCVRIFSFSVHEALIISQIQF